MIFHKQRNHTEGGEGGGDRGTHQHGHGTAGHAHSVTPTAIYKESVVCTRRKTAGAAISIYLYKLTRGGERPPERRALLGPSVGVGGGWGSRPPPHRPGDREQNGHNPDFLEEFGLVER